MYNHAGAPSYSSKIIRAASRICSRPLPVNPNVASYLNDGLLNTCFLTSNTDSPCRTRKYLLCNRDGSSMNATARFGRVSPPAALPIAVAIAARRLIDPLPAPPAPSDSRTAPSDDVPGTDPSTPPRSFSRIPPARASIEARVPRPAANAPSIRFALARVALARVARDLDDVVDRPATTVDDVAILPSRLSSSRTRARRRTNRTHRVSASHARTRVGKQCARRVRTSRVPPPRWVTTGDITRTVTRARSSPHHDGSRSVTSRTRTRGGTIGGS